MKVQVSFARALREFDWYAARMYGEMVRHAHQPFDQPSKIEQTQHVDGHMPESGVYERRTNQAPPFARSHEGAV